MSTAKRSRQRQSDAQTATTLPASKRVKTGKNSHVPARNGLDFLVDEYARIGKKLEAKLTNGTPSTKTSRVDESHAVVAPDTGAGAEEDEIVVKPKKEVIDISSAEESSEYEDSDEEPDHAKEVDADGSLPLTNGHVSDTSESESDQEEEEAVQDGEQEEQVVVGAKDVDMADDYQQEAEPVEAEAEPAEPSFGEMLQARHPTPIDLRALSDPLAGSRAMISAPSNGPLAVPQGLSLSTTLTQALNTNDKDNLERCFQSNDKDTIRATIQRLPSRQAATLLQRLAERIHRRPGRTGNLMIWVQWSLICHGGYLATQPDVMAQLRSLSRVVKARASGLQPLLHLKGKLEMLSAQLEMRKKMQQESRAANADEDDDEEAVIYVEGQNEDDWSESDEEMAEEAEEDPKLLEPPIRKPKAQQLTPRTNDSEADDMGETGDGQLPNGVAHDSDDTSEEDDEDAEGLLDVEAEETSEEEDEEASSAVEAESDAQSASELEDESADDESDAIEVKQPKATTLNRKR